LSPSSRTNNAKAVPKITFDTDGEKFKRELKKHIPQGIPVTEAIAVLKRNGFVIDGDAGRYAVTARYEQSRGFLDYTWSVSIHAEEGKVIEVKSTVSGVGL